MKIDPRLQIFFDWSTHDYLVNLELSNLILQPIIMREESVNWVIIHWPLRLQNLNRLEQ